ncbi:MAG TPA: lipoyl synthase [Candidatus Omnitrophota bacterium]|nr:lipoyl synthase [Candidatus Omnitrophota bacterium]
MLSLRKPSWLKKKIEFDSSRQTSLLLKKIGVNTVCKEAKCPNLSECFKRSHATFLILGKHCTRNCRFCNVEKGKPQELDTEEHLKVAEAVEKLDLKHVVVTSVTRDDLADGGAEMFAKTVQAIRKTTSVELLIPDLAGNEDAIKKIALSSPSILGHNIETVPRLYNLRPGANYARSLYVLKHAKKINKNVLTKSALMLGLGECQEEVINVMQDLISIKCDFLALGQYLRPSLKACEVAEYIEPEVFDRYKKAGLDMGFKHIEAGPFVRSSYRAIDYFSTGI